MKPKSRSKQNLSLCRSVGFAFGIMLALIATSASAAQPAEICDGIDNDGNGLVDEGFDVDGDGVARCCSRDPFFATTTNSNQQIEVHYNACSAAGFTPGITPAFSDPQAVVQLHGVGNFNQTPGLDILWRDVGVNWGQRNLTTCLKGEWQTFLLDVSDLSYFGGADMDLNGTLDVIGWHLNSFTGITALNAGGFLPSFLDLYGTYNINALQGAWGTAYAYNLEDMTNDGIPDFMFWEYANGGASNSEFHTKFGNGNGTFGPLTNPSDIVGQPQNFGDLGDVDLDGCTDWVGGPDDDGNRGVVMVRFGTCSTPACRTALARVVVPRRA